MLDNAIKYGQNNNNIELTVEKNIEFEFKVRDYGIGISIENIKKITEPFFQANKNISTKGQKTTLFGALSESVFHLFSRPVFGVIFDSILESIWG